MNNFIVLAVFSGFSFNLVLKFGLGVKEIFDNRKHPVAGCLFQWLIMFITVFASWLIFTFILAPLTLGFFEYFLLFPLTVFLTGSLEKMLFMLFPGDLSRNTGFSAHSAYSGLALTALILTLRLADTTSDALLLSFGFSSGVFFSIVLLRMIKIRTKNEKILPLFDGQPLMLTSMALLSLVFSSIAYITLLYPLTF
jgi:Na+-translocating ferredoxin:NAD+ oxidoreductase RnfA subunit